MKSKFYCYDENRVFCGIVFAEKQPDNCLTVQPQTIGDGQCAVAGDEDWNIVDDAFGKNVYDARNGAVYVIAKHGALPDYLQTPPPIEYLRQQLIGRLWTAATAYVEAQINAAEYAKTIDLANKGNTKAIANLDWYNNVWTDYYNRTAAIAAGELIQSMDFSNNFNKPWKFWEVIAMSNV